MRSLTARIVTASIEPSVTSLHQTLALETYAQIVDGLPIRKVAWDQSHSLLEKRHPINHHLILCPEVLETTREIRDTFDIKTLSFNPKLLQAYQSAPPSTRLFNLRLLEITAAAVHQIGILLFKLKLLMHVPATTNGSDIDTVTRWEPPPDKFARIEPHPTLFSQPYFIAHEQYPDGVADMVGYWAEDRILGGVALFDRSRTWDRINEPEPNAYFHSGRARTTFFICQLVDEQQDELVRFLTEGRDGRIGSVISATSATHRYDSNGPLPIRLSSRNKVRITPGDATEVHKIYRDPWERRPPPETIFDREPCVPNSIDYPDLDVAGEIDRLNEVWEKSHRK